MQYHAAVGHSKSRMRHCLQRGTVRFVPTPSKRLKPLSVCDTALRLVRRASLCSSTMNANARRTRAQRAYALFGGQGSECCCKCNPLPRSRAVRITQMSSKSTKFVCVAPEAHATRPLLANHPCSLLFGARAICEWCANAPTQMRSRVRLSVRTMSAWHAMSGRIRWRRGLSSRVVRRSSTCQRAQLAAATKACAEKLTGR